VNQAAEIIAGEIADEGAIPFARFMELALYCPIYGYYERERDNIGRRGDYYTSVSVGSLFGELLAFQFAEWLAESQVSSAKRPVPGAQGEAGAGTEIVRIVEAGAHGGRLARDILVWMRQHRPAIFQGLEYWIVEPSEQRWGWQQEALAEFAAKLHWVKQLPELLSVPASSPARRCSLPSVRGIIFSNELLDAMPAHRLGWDAKERMWYEWGVTSEGGRFVWTRMPAHSPKSKVTSLQPGVNSPPGRAESSIGSWHLAISHELLDVLPDGFTIEICPAAEQWWREAASVLDCGRLVTLDYGLTTDELFAPERKEGTARGYSHHQSSRDVLAHPGEQDITAHVNFTGIQATGESAGLTTDAFLTQTQFLTGIAAQVWKGGASFAEWTPERTRQFQTLTHPEHLGRSFRVLVQSRT
jgi:SAM-dependent MidA family methyltransferase